jgi:hypothetical protein
LSYDFGDAVANAAEKPGVRSRREERGGTSRGYARRRYCRVIVGCVCPSNFMTLTRLRRYAASRRQARARPDAHRDRPARRYRRQPFADRRSTPVGDQCSGASFSHRKHLARRGGFGERNRLGRISPQRDRYCELSRRMREFAEDVLFPWPYRVPARCPIGGRCPQTGSKVRRQVFLIFSEWIARSGCRLRQGICAGAAFASEYPVTLSGVRGFHASSPESALRKITFPPPISTRDLFTGRLRLVLLSVRMERSRHGTYTFTPNFPKRLTPPPGHHDGWRLHEPTSITGHRVPTRAVGLRS